MTQYYDEPSSLLSHLTQLALASAISEAVYLSAELVAS